MLKIGLTGPSGAGKGMVSSLLSPYGIPSIDTDAIYHELLIPPSACLDELVVRFGRSILTSGGTLDRRALAAIVFASGHEAERADLNRITHRHILDRVRTICREHDRTGATAVLIDAPVLFESGFDRECDKTLAVLSDRERRLARITERDGLDETAARMRLDAQPDDDFYISRADAAIYNDGVPADMDAPLRALLKEWGVTLP